MEKHELGKTDNCANGFAMGNRTKLLTRDEFGAAVSRCRRRFDAAR
jgi:hypothetical protein